MPDKPAPFAKLFEIDGHQVLYYREPDAEADEIEREMIHQIASFPTATVDMTIRNLKEATADAIFAAIDEDKARAFREHFAENPLLSALAPD